MILHILLYALAGIIFLNIGALLGHWSWNVYWNSKGKRSWQTFILYPISHVRKEVGYITPGDTAFISGFEKESKEEYIILMSWLWCLKVLFNLCTTTLISCYFIIIGMPLTVAKIANIVTLSDSRVTQMSATLKKKQQPESSLPQAQVHKRNPNENRAES